MTLLSIHQHLGVDGNTGSRVCDCAIRGGGLLRAVLISVLALATGCARKPLTCPAPVTVELPVPVRQPAPPVFPPIVWQTAAFPPAPTFSDVALAYETDLDVCRARVEAQAIALDAYRGTP